MEHIYEILKKFHFTKIESEIYIHLLQYPELNGSQMAKIVNLTRSSVYGALRALQKKGAAILIPGKVNVYRAEDPETLLDRLKKEYSESAESIKEELSRLSIKKPAEGFANLQGYYNVISKIKEDLLSAKKEIYIHTTMQLSLFRDEILELRARGVRIIIFSFTAINPENLPVELYHSKKFKSSIEKNLKMMMVVDQQKALITRGSEEEEFLGVYSRNTLLVNLVSEHIHHDIYLHKLEEKHEVINIVTDDILLGSIQENQFSHKILK